MEAYQSKLNEIADTVYARIGQALNMDNYMTEAHLSEVGGSYLEHRGKCLRPALLTLCCEAVADAPRAPLTAAAAVEMFHTWTLMHDDVIDHDDMRRGRPTAHVRGRRLGERDLPPEADAAEYGVVLAILGGDYVFGSAMDMLLQTPCHPEVLRSVARRMAGKLNAELLSGEQFDVRLSLTPWEAITEENVMQMMRGKTGALLAYCAETGVAIGEDVPPEKSSSAQKMAEFAHLCGLAFQMKDDLLGIFGDESKFGKPIGSDIREGKRTVLMLRTLQNASDADAKSLLAVLGKKEATTEEIENARAVIVKTGAEKAVVKLSDAYVDQALRILEATLPAGTPKAFLRQWALSMVARSV